MKHPAFISGDFDTHFVKHYFTKEAMVEDSKTVEMIAAMAGLNVYLEGRKKLRVPGEING
jgi:propionyl-CoA carboxylase alpha chain